MERAARIIPPRTKSAPDVDLEPFQKMVNETAARVRGLWLGYIALLAYLIIAVGSVTHRDLLLQSPVKLPVLNVELPFVGFFVVAPAFFLINHFYLLIQLFELARRITAFNREVTNPNLNDAARESELLKLDSFVIVQMLAATPKESNALLGKLLHAIAIITLVVAPITLLLTIQLQFLAYQEFSVTWWHRVAATVDLFWLWTFWPSIKRGKWAPGKGTFIWKTTTGAVLLFTFFIATFPGEFLDGGTKASEWKEPKDSYLGSLKQQLFGDNSANLERARVLPFSRTIELPDNTTLIDLDQLDKIRIRHRAGDDDELKPWLTRRTLELRGRQLRGAKLDNSDLRNVDFLNASLQGASLFGARLQGASLENANLQGALLSAANLQGASLNGARLQGASVKRTSLQGASLFGANLQGASLNGAGLQGASLTGANLQGASLEQARLQGASLERANLQGASLNNTFLWRTIGRPNPNALAQMQVNEPQLQALTAEDLIKLEAAALDGVESEEARQQIKKRIARLRVAETEVQNSLKPAYWNDLANKVKEFDYQKVLSNHLKALACDESNAPYVAQGLVSNPDLIEEAIEKDGFMEEVVMEIMLMGGAVKEEAIKGVAIKDRLTDVGPTHLPRLAKTLLDAAEGKSTDCPGVKGLNATAMAKLRKWVAEGDAEPKQNYKMRQ